jgi:hypothetical protein
MPGIKNLVGCTFGRLKVVEFAGRRAKKAGKPKTYWKCLCECGSATEVEGGNLRSGSTKSCGCLRRSALDKTTHGLSSHPLYYVWQGMLGRCTDPTDSRFPDYGGRGIDVCQRWQTAENFISDMGHRPKGSSLERIDNDAGYSPENCIWADAKAQQNNKRTNYRVTVGSTTLTVQQWAEKMQISPYTLHSRLVKLKWSPERAVSAAVTPQPWRRREGEGRTNTRT